MFFALIRRFEQRAVRCLKRRYLLHVDSSQKISYFALNAA